MFDENSVFFSSLSNKGMDYIGQLFTTNGKIKSWDEITTR